MSDLVATATIRDAQFRAGLSRMERDGRAAMGGVGAAGDRAAGATNRLAGAVRLAKVGLRAAGAAAGTVAVLTAQYAKKNELAAASLRDVKAASSRLATAVQRDFFVFSGGANIAAAAIDAMTAAYTRWTSAVNRRLGDGSLDEARKYARMMEAAQKERLDAAERDRLVGDSTARRATAEGRDMDALTAQQALRRRALLDTLNTSTLPGNTRQEIIAEAEAADEAERRALGAQIGERARQAEATEYIRRHGRTGDRALEGGAGHLFRQVFGPGAKSEDVREQKRHEAELEQLRLANRNLERIAKGVGAKYQ